MNGEASDSSVISGTICHRALILFWEFFKIASLVVGGGFAILLVAEDIFVHKYHWLRDNELSDMLALIQTVPGLTAGNVAIYAGYRIAGVFGAFAALVGVAMPSFLVITLVAVAFGAVPFEHPVVQGAFVGVRSAMAGLTLVALVRMWPRSLRDAVQYLIFVFGVVAVTLFHVHPGLLLGGALVFGPIWCCLICRKIPPAAQEEEAS